MTTPIRRLGAFLLEPADPAASPPPPPSSAPSVLQARAAVLGSPVHVPPVAAACAGELRARAKAAAALVCLWRPGGDPLDADPASPAGATTPAARRVAAALGAEGLRATACGRLAWLALPDDPAEAAPVLRRGLALAEVPVVIAVAGPRPAAFEPVLATADVALAVLPADAAESLRDLVRAALPGAGHIVAPLPPGPPRWAALAGLIRLRSLPVEP